MRISLFIFVLVFSFFTSAQNYSLPQVKLDLNEHKKPVYFCFTNSTYNPSFARNDLKTFQSYIQEYLKYNFIFHLENHDTKWEALANTQKGIQYAIVCDLRMRFGVEGTITLYYQDTIRDLQWEQVASVNYSTKQEKDWIKDTSFNLSEKLKSELEKDKFVSWVEEELKKRDKILSEQQKKIAQLQQKLKEKLETKDKELENTISLLERVINEQGQAIIKLEKKRDSELKTLRENLNNLRDSVLKAKQNNIVNVTIHKSYQRRKISGSQSIELERFIVNKKSPTSVLLIQGTMSTIGGDAGHMQQGWKYGDSPEVFAQTTNYAGGHSWGLIYSTCAVIQGHKKTGEQELVFRYFKKGNLNYGTSPFSVYNPKTEDDRDKRIEQTGSVYTVWEIELNYF